ncbi:hypothetical protein TSUD_90730 [Trifolium subterraneum]|uniref:Zinc-finger domain-containing protein n=1 Tax=Trifolium subterraneum TaxID=3900 RepID=A0A2Z6PBY6_TRISU|nr:hypothetical protein TSUD_90730 [Trifolium subterraneum]
MTLPPVDYGLKRPRAQHQQHSSSRWGPHIYDPIKGEKCRQCGHITISQLTSCNKCELPQGKLCGDFLYTRYGENVIEADFNPKWTCPCCREICNWKSCRRKNGLMPTGNIYNKGLYGYSEADCSPFSFCVCMVVKLGFKSVAHYLIKTRCSEGSIEGSGAENIVAQEIPKTTPEITQKGQIRTRRALRS